MLARVKPNAILRVCSIGDDARVYALSVASINLLKEVGAWRRIEQSKRKADYTQMQVWQTNGVGELNFGDAQTPQLLGSMLSLLSSKKRCMTVLTMSILSIRSILFAPYCRA
ncbi:MAG: hypothetical protein U1E92_07290 [Moraxella osloensis]